MALTSLKHVARFAYGDALALEARSEGEVPVFGSNGITGAHDVPNTLGPAIIVGRKGSFGKVTWTDVAGFCIDTAYYIDSRTTNANLRWLYWALQTLGLDQHSEDTGVPGLSREKAYQAKVRFPTPVEQERIANFLDEQTARIDALIAEKERLVSSLSNLRKSVIHAIVTGTYSTPGVKTGSRYFPLMARGWSFTRVKYIATSLDNRRIPLNSEERAIRQGAFPYYGASGQIDSVDAYIFDEPLVLVGEDGANLLNRATPLAFVAEGKYWVNNHAHLLRPHDGRVRLWARAIDSLDITDWVSGSAQPKLTIDALMNLPVPEIPEHLRDELDTILVREESRIDALVTHTGEHIERLREYRSSLISAAVTGQLNIDAFRARQLEAA